jgi:predicted nucleic acid-binding protein
MSDVVLDANVLVGLLDQNDSLHQRSTELLERMQRDGDRPVMLDVMVAEMVSALCRRATQRKSGPPDLGRVRDRVHGWLDAGLVTFVHDAVAELFEEIVDAAEASGGTLNFNDAALVLLQREGTIGDVATFDAKLAGAAGFRSLT